MLRKNKYGASGSQVYIPPEDLLKVDVVLPRRAMRFAWTLLRARMKRLKVKRDYVKDIARDFVPSKTSGKLGSLISVYTVIVESIDL